MLNVSDILKNLGRKKSPAPQPAPKKPEPPKGPPVSASEKKRLAELYRYIKGTQAPTYTDSEIDYPKPLQSISVKHPQEMIRSQAYMLSLINQQLGMKEDDFVRYVLTTVENYAAWVQLLPASESYHHTAIGGLFAHSLDVSLRALKIFENRNVYVEGTALEREGALIKFRLAAFLGGMLHDIGKIFEDITVTAPDGRVWCSQVEPLYTWAVRNDITKYQYVWRKGRHLESHELYTAYYLPRIVPQHVFRWLGEGEPNVSRVLIGALSGNSDAAYGRIWDIVQKADSSSTKADVDAHGSTDNAKEYEIPVGMYFCKAVCELLKNNTWTVNTPTSQVFVFDSGVFVIWSKRTFNDLMAYFDEAGYSGIPRQSFELAQLIAESTIAVTNSIYPADSKQEPEPYPLWRVKLQGTKGDIQLMAIRVKQAARIFEASTIPYAVHGEILDITPEDLAEKQDFSWDPEFAKKPEPKPESPESDDGQNDAKPARQQQRQPQTPKVKRLVRDDEPQPTAPVRPAPQPVQQDDCDDDEDDDSVPAAARPRPPEAAKPAEKPNPARRQAKDEEDDDDFIREQNDYDDEEVIVAKASPAVAEDDDDDGEEDEEAYTQSDLAETVHDHVAVPDEEAVDGEEEDGDAADTKPEVDAKDDTDNDADTEAEAVEEVPVKRVSRSPNRLRLLDELRAPGPASTSLVLTHPLLKNMCRTLRSHETYTGPVAQLIFEIAIAMSIGRISVMWLQCHSIIPPRIRETVDENLLQDIPDPVKVVLLSQDGILSDAVGRVERLSALVSLFPGRSAALSQAIDKLKECGMADIVTLTGEEAEFPVKNCFSVRPLVEKAAADLVKDKASDEGLRLKTYANMAVMSLVSDFSHALDSDADYALTDGSINLLNEVCSNVGESTVSAGLARVSSAAPAEPADEEPGGFRRNGWDDRRTAVSPRFDDVFCILRDQIRSGGGNWTVNLKLNEGGGVLSVDTFENIVRDFPEFTQMALSDYLFSGSAAPLGFTIRGNKIYYSEADKS